MRRIVVRTPSLIPIPASEASITSSRIFPTSSTQAVAVVGATRIARDSAISNRGCSLAIRHGSSIVSSVSARGIIVSRNRVNRSPAVRGSISSMGRCVTGSIDGVSSTMIIVYLSLASTAPFLSSRGLAITRIIEGMGRIVPSSAPFLTSGNGAIPYPISMNFATIRVTVPTRDRMITV